MSLASSGTVASGNSSASTARLPNTDGAQPLANSTSRAVRSRNASAGSMKAAARVGVAMRGR